MGFNFGRMLGRSPGMIGALDQASGPSNLPMPPNPTPMALPPKGSPSGGGQAVGPWGAAIKGAMNPAQGMYSQNNMGMNQATPQAPMGMGGNPMNNLMNPYQGPIQGSLNGMENPNQRNPFMGGMGGIMSSLALGRYRR